MKPVLAVALTAFLLAPAAGVRVPAPEEDEVTMIPVEGEGAKYWPRWRGPSGQGLAMGSGYVDKWSDTENVKWKTKLDTTGNGSPIVWANRIFLTIASGDGARRGIAAFDRATGRKLWETYAPDANNQLTNLKNGNASSTPTTDGRLVYAYLGPKGVMAVDFAGKLAWHAPVGKMNAPHGPAGSPLLYKDRIIVFQDHVAEGGGFIAAFDAKTGERRWSKRRKEQAGWGTPIAIRAGTRDEIIVSSMFAVYAYNPDNGEVLWTVRHGNSEVIPTPVAGLGLVFASFGRQGPTFAIRPGGSGDVTSTHVAWQATKGAPYVPSTLLYGDQLYMINDQTSVATAYEAKSGAVLWQGRLGELAVNGFSTSPVGVDGKVFFTNEEGETFVLKAGKTFELLHVNKVNEPMLASPAMVDGTWYFRTPEHLFAVGASAQTQPDFTGSWRIDPSKSDKFSGGAPPETITVEGNRMTVIRTRAGNKETSVYMLDGTPSKNTVGPAGQQSEITYTSKWEGNVLVTTIPLQTITRIEKRSIQENCTMKNEVTFIFKDGKTETGWMVFNKVK
jgi:outer membrane protein assembly factor BamB